MLALILSSAVSAACGPVVNDDASVDSSRDASRDTSFDAGPLIFRYVRLQQLSNPEGGAHPGADIDALVVIKPDGSMSYAQSVISVADAINASDALGAPDEPPDCLVADYASLGERGGYIVFAFGAPIDAAGIEVGDTIIVYEVTAADCPASGDDIIEVTISIAPLPEGPFTPVAGCGLGVCTRMVL
jgi:hypothetical protein